MNRSVIALHRLEIAVAFVFWLGAASTMLVGVIDPLTSVAVAAMALVGIFLARLVLKDRQKR